ncbi:50S ribosomal protein L6 [Candidatus Portiera aleyrodidarum]|uniref:50S ribosomal protein L6 n=1 Tax=Candidatus Portiera aleyrodidarum TaxID=91844 RepID=A0A6S6RT21_9GAMM|nr:50S ribosomal protein L6 [Candidatus Portiera aleyrodidarum]CAA3705179.1 50S ribosomal protein L6 [Candidatus Portiera aleyrodidarum]
MSKIAKCPIKIPDNVDIILDKEIVMISGKNGRLFLKKHSSVLIVKENKKLKFHSKLKKNWVIAGTMRALVNNMIIGVYKGFTKKLEINGVGYRAKINGRRINLMLGYSHRIEYKLPKNILAETYGNTVIVLKSAHKQMLGKVAAEIRSVRPIESYKGRGIRYSDEKIKYKEVKKK